MYFSKVCECDGKEGVQIKYVQCLKTCKTPCLIINQIK